MEVPIKTITIGNAYKDAELIEKIWKFKEDRNLRNASEAVRILCEDALNMKKAMER